MKYSNLFLLIFLLGGCGSRQEAPPENSVAESTGMGTEQEKMAESEQTSDDGFGFFKRVDLRAYPSITADSIASLVSAEQVLGFYEGEGTIEPKLEGKTCWYRWKGPESKSGEITVSVREKISAEQNNMEVASRDAMAQQGLLEEIDLPNRGVKAYWNPAKRFHELEVFTRDVRLSIKTGLMVSQQPYANENTKRVAIQLANLLLDAK